MQPQDAEKTKMTAPQSTNKVRLVFHRDAEYHAKDRVEQFRAGSTYEVDEVVAQDMLGRVYESPYTFSGERPKSEAERKPIRVAEVAK